MPAPTALQRVPDGIAETLEANTIAEDYEKEEVLVDFTNTTPDTTLIQSPDAETVKDGGSMALDMEGRPRFGPAQLGDEKHVQESRKVPIPPHRMTPLKNAWSKIYPPLVEHLQLQVRMNTKTRSVELRNSKITKDPGALQKGEDFVHAFALGFDVDDATALLRLDDLYIETFEIKDVKSLQGEHLSRAIGRIAGKDGKMKFSIENASRTRIVLADQKVHILGGFQAIHIAREAIVSLILGSPPGKVYGNLRTVASRMKQKF